MRRLAADGHEVVVFHRGEHEGDLPKQVRHIRSEEAAMPVCTIPEELRRLEPEVVVHMIAMGEQDALIAVTAFAGVAGRLVVASSGDVYRAYDVCRNRDAGPADPAPLREDSQLRTQLYPYRDQAAPGSLEYDYDKILVERAATADPRLPTTILRFPKLYGPGDNGDLATVYAYREHPHWRWTHGYVENVGAAVALAATDGRASGQIYNVGEEHTPTMGERLAKLPPNDVPLSTVPLNYDQPIVYDTSRIRSELGYREVIDEREAMERLARRMQKRR